MIKIYALILNYNSATETVELYNDLQKFYQSKVNILVIDNFSKVSEREFLQRVIPGENLILHSRNNGYAAGNNIGIQIALDSKADYVWVLNPDTRVKSDTLPILIKTLKMDPKLAAVGPRIIHRNNPERIFSDGERVILDEKVTTLHKNHNCEVSKSEKRIDYDIDYIAGSSILLNSNAIRDIGKFPEEYFLYFEETDWCLRARKRNWKLAINSYAEVFNLTSNKDSVFHFYFMRNKLIFSKKYHSNFKKVRRYYCREIFRTIVSRLKGKYFPPFFTSYVKGFITGIIKTS